MHHGPAKKEEKNEKDRKGTGAVPLQALHRGSGLNSLHAGLREQSRE